MSNLTELIAAAGADLAEHASPEPGPDRFVSRTDRARAYVLEAVFEAYLLHYRRPRAFVGMDPDLRLLAGDALYAHALARLAELRDMEAVTELADLISLCAWAEAAGRRDVVDRLWGASAGRLLGHTGGGARVEAAADLARGRA